MRTILFLFLPFLLSAQEVVKDTSYTEQVGSVFYSVQVIEYDNGSIQTKKDVIGSSAQVFEEAKGRFVSSANRLANDAVFVADFSKKLTDIIRENANLKTVTGKSPLDTLQAKNIAPFLVAAWTLKDLTTSKDVNFSVNAAGQMKYKANTEATKNATLIGVSAIRLHNYPATGSNLDLFRKPNGNYGDISGNYVLKKPPDAQNRKKKK